MIINQVGGSASPSNGEKLTDVTFACSLKNGDFVTTNSGKMMMPGVGVDFRPGNNNDDYNTSGNCYFTYNNQSYSALCSCWLTDTTGFGICKVEGTSKPYTQTVLFYQETLTDNMTIEWSAEPVLSLSLENSVGMSILGLVPIDNQYLLLVYCTGVNNEYSSDVKYWAIKTLKWDGTQLALAASWRDTENRVDVPLSYVSSSGSVYLYLYPNSSGGFYLLMIRYIPDGENSSMSWSSDRYLGVFALSATCSVQSFVQKSLNVTSSSLEPNRLCLGVDEVNDKVYVELGMSNQWKTYLSIYDIKTDTLTNAPYGTPVTSSQYIIGDSFIIKNNYFYKFRYYQSKYLFGVYGYSVDSEPDFDNPIAEFELPSTYGYACYIEDLSHIYVIATNSQEFYSGDEKTGGEIYLYRLSFDGTKLAQNGDMLLLAETNRFLYVPLLNIKKVNDALVVNGYYLNTKMHFIPPISEQVLGIKKNDTTVIVPKIIK